MSSLTKTQESIKSLISTLLNNQNHPYKTPNKIYNLQYGGSMEDFSQQATKQKILKIIEKLEINNQSEKADILEDLVFLELSSIDEEYLSTGSTVNKSINFLLNLARKEFVVNDFEYKLQEVREEKSFQRAQSEQNEPTVTFNQSTRDVNSGDDESELSKYEFGDYLEEELSDWSNDSDIDDDSDGSGDFQAKHDISGQSFTSSSYLSTDEDDYLNENQQAPHMDCLYANPFEVSSTIGLTTNCSNKILVTELDVCCNLIKNLMYGNTSSHTAGAMQDSSFELFKTTNTSLCAPKTLEEINFKIPHLSEGSLCNILKWFTKYVNVSKNILNFSKIITDSRRASDLKSEKSRYLTVSEKDFKFNIYVNELVAILNLEYQKLHNLLENYYTDLITFKISGNLLHLKLFVFKNFKVINNLWKIINKCFDGGKTGHLSHQERYSLILTEFYKIQNEGKICEDLLKCEEDRLLEEVKTGPDAQRNIRCSVFEDPVIDLNVDPDFWVKLSHTQTVPDNVPKIHVDMHEIEPRYQNLFLIYWLRMFQLCKSSIDTMLRGNYNCRLNPVYLDVCLEGRFWDIIGRVG